jgi:CO/xanthine dehydrogenase FAD-binding subunit
MIRFEILEPRDSLEAISLLAQYRENAKIIAGGQSLLPLLKHRQVVPDYLISIKGLPDLEYISDHDGRIRIGALVTNRAIEFSPLIKERYPMLADLEQMVGDVQTRNWGTLVGNLCAASPTSDLAPALIALGAKVRAVSLRGEREIPLENFFIDYLKTILEPDEIVTEVELLEMPACTGAAYYKERVRMTDSPVASVAAMISLDERTKLIRNAHIVLQAVCPTPRRAREAEKKLVGQKMNENVLHETAAAAAVEACPISDVYGSAEYKNEMVKVVTRRVVSDAIEEANRRGGE